MEKKTYSKPVLSAQRFEPQEYCVPCGDGAEEVTYFFQCNAGSYTTWQEVYLETNGREGLQTSGSIIPWRPADEYLGRYHACNETHEVKVDANTPFNIDQEFPLGYVHAATTVGTQTTYQWIPVRIWRGDDGRNLHCTTNIEESHYVPHNPS